MLRNRVPGQAALDAVPDCVTIRGKAVLADTKIPVFFTVRRKAACVGHRAPKPQDAHRRQCAVAGTQKVGFYEYAIGWLFDCETPRVYTRYTALCPNGTYKSH